MWSLFMILTSLLTVVDQCDVFWVASNRASLTRTDSARKMKEAKRFMWMLFLMQCSFLINNSFYQTPQAQLELLLPVYILRYMVSLNKHNIANMLILHLTVTLYPFFQTQSSIVLCALSHTDFT